MPATAEGVSLSKDEPGSVLPDLEHASRAELQLTLEQLARANRRLALLNRVATELMNDSQHSFGALFKAIAEEIGARHFFYQRVDTIRPDLLHLAVSSEQKDGEADICGILLSAVSDLAPPQRPLVFEAPDIAKNPHFASIQLLGLQSFMRVPLLAHDRLLGTVSFASTTNPRFLAADWEFVRTFADQLTAAVQRQHLMQQLKVSEQLYRGAVITGRLASWETNMVTRERIWTEEGMEMFGLDLPNGRGVVGGDKDEFWLTLHPDDRYKVAEFHKTADQKDFYPAEYRIVRSDGRLMWMSGRGRVIERDTDGKARRVANIVVDVTERKKSEERTKLLIDELNHRVKNTLATVQAIVSQTLKGERAGSDPRNTIEARLQSLSRSHDLLTRERWEGAGLHEVVHEALHPFIGSHDDRQVRVEGRQLRLKPKVALSLGMALHELATNASKYGALSLDSGRIAISWSPVAIDDTLFLELRWQERGGPIVQPRSHRGFGSRLIEQGLAHDLGGSARLEYSPEGLECVIRFPMPASEGCQ